VKNKPPNATSLIAFDTWVLGGYARNHGVHVYARELLTHFREIAPNYLVEVSPFVSAGVDNEACMFPAAPGFKPRETSLLKCSRLWRFGGACALTSLQKSDLIFSPHCTSLYAAAMVPSVVTIHDLIPVLMPWGSRRITATLRFCLSWAAKFSSALITDSIYSKRDLIRVYGLPESKVSVVYLGFDNAIFNCAPLDDGLGQKLLERLGITRPYIFHHGVVKPNKNLKRLIQAYRLLLSRNRNVEMELVLAGPLGWEYEEVVAAAKDDSIPRARVILTGALSDPDLAKLLKGATLAVIPSLYEGFCIPLVEAMACGIPTIASNSSCLPEISGGVLRYFDPRSVDEMAVCMEEALENEGLRKELIEKGRVRANNFCWRRCAEETLALLAQVARSGSYKATS
jgi:glycosyltransferase involved in cell wall biosynthesis